MDADFLSLQQALMSRYSLERVLGRGGMGTVYLARDITLERAVAIKALPLESTGRDQSRARLLREARMAAQLQHPNIVAVHSVEELGEWIIIVMAYVDGGTLGDRIRARGLLTTADTSAIVRDVALALAYAHRRGVVHRDIKPENVLIDRESGRAMVADFGIAYAPASASTTGAGQFVGTPSYMSPEQAGGNAVDGRSDLYSLGVVMYACLTGRLPFPSDDARVVLAQHLTQIAPALAPLSPTATPEIVRAVERCLEKEPAARFQTGEDLAAALDTRAAAHGDLPPSVRSWVGLPGELTLGQVAGAPLLTIGIWAALDFFLNPLFGRIGPQNFDADIAMLIGFVLPPAIYLGRRMTLLRGTVAAGYGVRDIRHALQIAPTEGDDAVRSDGLQTVGLGVIVAMVVAIMITLQFLPGAPPWNPQLLDLPSYLIAFSAGALVQGGYLLARGKRLSDRIRRAFWDSALGSGLTRVLSAGLRGRRAMPEFANRGTELALGSAAMVLYEALPKTLRRRFDELPQAIQRLEAIALSQRNLIAQLPSTDSDAAGLSDAKAKDGSVGYAALVRNERARLEDLRRDAVTALQMIRLDLLRLSVSDGDLAQVTADLEKAVSLSRRMHLETDARREINDFLVSHHLPKAVS